MSSLTLVVDPPSTFLCLQIIHSNVNVAIAGGLEGDDLAALVLVILGALQEYMAEQVSTLGAAKEHPDIELNVNEIAAMINDYDRLQVRPHTMVTWT